MCFINERLELIRCSWPGRDSKKASYMISKASVVRMLLNSHQLDGCVPRFFNSRKNVLYILPVATDLPSFLSHTNMWFVDSQAWSAWRDRVWVSPLELLSGIPEHAIKQPTGTLILPLCPRRIPVHLLSVRTFNLQLIPVKVLHPRLTVLGLERNTEASKLISLCLKLLSIPPVKVSENWHWFCSRRPLHESKISVRL